jgi:hypothetical protein
MSRNKSFQRIFYNWQIKLLCFLLAVFMYFFLGLVLQETRTVILPLNVVMPEEFKADSIVPTTVELKITGKEDQVYMVDPSKITVTVDFSKVDQEGVSVAPVQIEMGNQEKVLDFSTLSITTDPSQVKVYFSLTN